VLKRGGVAAAWSYHAGHLESSLGGLLWGFYRDVVRSYFPPGFELVDDRYEGIHLPGSAIAAPHFWMEADWTIEQLLAFVRSWSGTQAYIRRHGRDPSDALRDPLAALFADQRITRRLRWPLYLRVSRL